MNKISLGYDPGPIGKYKITKILVDSDIDGAVSAAMLKIVYPEAKIYLGNYIGIEKGDYKKLVDEQTAMADLGYIPGCGLYFDHHASNKPKIKEFPGRWSNLGSAARVVYDYFRNVADLGKFAPIMDDIDKFDSGWIELAEVVNPSAVILLAFSVNRGEEKYARHVINLLINHNWREIMRDRQVMEHLQKDEESKQVFFEYIKDHSEIINHIVFVDLREFKGDKVHSYIMITHFPEVYAVVLFRKYGKEYRSTMYRNNFNPQALNLNLLKIAQKINPQAAGGHIASCGFAFPVGVKIATIKQTIVTEIAKQQKKP